jgi:hypothetical protein
VEFLLRFGPHDTTREATSAVYKTATFLIGVSALIQGAVFFGWLPN